MEADPQQLVARLGAAVPSLGFPAAMDLLVVAGIIGVDDEEFSAIGANLRELLSPGGPHEYRALHAEQAVIETHMAKQIRQTEVDFVVTLEPCVKRRRSPFREPGCATGILDFRAKTGIKIRRVIAGRWDFTSGLERLAREGVRAVLLHGPEHEAALGSAGAHVAEEVAVANAKLARDGKPTIELVRATELDPTNKTSLPREEKAENERRGELEPLLQILRTVGGTLLR